MKRIIGLDYGTKRIGVALSDPLRITAQPLKTIAVKNQEELPEELKQIVSGNEIEKVVVGLPLNMNGSEGESAQNARAFAEQIEQEFGIPVVLWDERLSSHSADLAMLEDSVRREKRKKHKDMIAAVIILQNYLDYLAG